MLKMPDLTPAMITTFVGQIIAVAIAFGVNLNPDQQKAILALSVTIGAVLLWADVQIRKNRAQNADKIAAAQKPPAPLTGTTAPAGYYVLGSPPVYAVDPTATPTKPVRKRPAARKPPTKPAK